MARSSKRSISSAAAQVVRQAAARDARDAARAIAYKAFLVWAAEEGIDVTARDAAYVARHGGLATDFYEEAAFHAWRGFAAAWAIAHPAAR